MAESARVESVDLLVGFQAVLWKFQAAANAAMEDADSELRRTMLWLEIEQENFWKDQTRKRQTAVERAKEAVRMKKLFRDHSGKPLSAIEEQKELQRAMVRLTEAEQKLANVRRWTRALQKEVELYKGSVQRLATSVESLVPAGVTHLERLVAELQAYASIASPGGVSSENAGPFTLVSPAAEGAVMSRGAPGSKEPTPQRLESELLLPSSEERRIAAPQKQWPFAAPTLTDSQLSAIEPLTGEDPTLRPEAKITFAESTDNQPCLLTLRRTEPLSPEDTGWCLMPLGKAHGPWRSITVADIAQKSPEWLKILKLPVGFSVILDLQGSAEIKDPQGRDVGTQRK